MKKTNTRAFTLVEMIVSITILSLIMISLIAVYVITSDVALRSEINRAMQENLKTATEQISEDLRNNKLTWVSSNINSCSFNALPEFYTEWTKLCTSENSYYLAKNGVRVIDVSSCDELQEHCVLYKERKGPITNSRVSVKDLKFTVSTVYEDKVTISMLLQPAAGKGYKPSLIKDNTIRFQTTISARSLNQ